MEIRFAGQRPEDADVLGFIVTKSGWADFALSARQSSGGP